MPGRLNISDRQKDNSWIDQTLGAWAFINSAKALKMSKYAACSLEYYIAALRTMEGLPCCLFKAQDLFMSKK